MKSRNVLWTMLIVLCIAGAAVYIYGPRAVLLDTQGVKYRLGEGNAGKEQLVQVKIEGDIWREWNGVPKFVGTIDIEGEVPEVPNERKKVEVNLSEEAIERLIIYDYFDNEGLHMIAYGRLYTDKSMERISINVFEETEGSAEGGRGWDSGSGLVITAPAQNRQEALKIANELMEKTMDGQTLN